MFSRGKRRNARKWLFLSLAGCCQVAPVQFLPVLWQSLSRSPYELFSATFLRFQRFIKLFRLIKAEACWCDLWGINHVRDALSAALLYPQYAFSEWDYTWASGTRCTSCFELVRAGSSR